jgi:hypothetical protein
MSLETTPDGRPAIRIEVRTGNDGWTRAAIQLGSGGEWMVLLQVPAQAYTQSTEVQSCVIALARAVVAAAIAEAMPGMTIERTDVVAPGAPIGGPKH